MASKGVSTAAHEDNVATLNTEDDEIQPLNEEVNEIKDNELLQEIERMRQERNDAIAALKKFKEASQLQIHKYKEINRVLNEDLIKQRDALSVMQDELQQNKIAVITTEESVQKENEELRQQLESAKKIIQQREASLQNQRRHTEKYQKREENASMEAAKFLIKCDRLTQERDDAIEDLKQFEQYKRKNDALNKKVAEITDTLKTLRIEQHEKMMHRDEEIMRLNEQLERARNKVKDQTSNRDIASKQLQQPQRATSPSGNDHEQLYQEIDESRRENEALKLHVDSMEAKESNETSDAFIEEKEDQDIMELWSRETLINKYEIVSANNLILQKRIMQLVSPAEDKSEFSEIEDIRAMFDTLRKQIHLDVCYTMSIHDQYKINL